MVILDEMGEHVALMNCIGNIRVSVENKITQYNNHRSVTIYILYWGQELNFGY